MTNSVSTATGKGHRQGAPCLAGSDRVLLRTDDDHPVDEVPPIGREGEYCGRAAGRHMPPSSRAMTATPLHSRMLTLRLSWADDRQLLAEGRLIDLRKRGIVPRLGTIQGPGVLHDLTTRVWLDAADLRIRTVETTMREYPFAPSPQTGGEGCPARLDRLQRLIGLRLDHNYGETLMGQIGGPQGCFHILTLLRLLGPSVVWAMTHESVRTTGNGAGQPAIGSPIFARSLVIDGMIEDSRQLSLQGGLLDIHFPPGAETLPLEEELLEAAVHVTVTLPELTTTNASGQLRTSGPGVKRVGPWQTITSLSRLEGVAMRKGYAATVQGLFGDAAGTHPLTHLLVVLAPVVMQCMPSLRDLLDVRPRRAEGLHAAIDSCHMWRAGGPLEPMIQSSAAWH